MAKETLNLRITREEKELLRQKAARDRVSITGLIRRFAAGLVALLVVACGGSSESFVSPPASTGGAGSSSGTGGSGSSAGQATSAGRSGGAGQPADVAGTGGAAGHHHGSGGTHANGTGGAPIATGGSNSTEGGASGDVGAGGSEDLSGAGGEPPAVGGMPAGGSPATGGVGGSSAGVSGSAGSPAAGTGGSPTACPEHSGTCGTETPDKIVISTIPYEYCMKVTFLAPAEVWTGTSGPNSCPSRAADLQVPSGFDPSMCRVFWGREAAQPPAVTSYDGIVVDSALEPCVTFISKELYDSVPGNSFCSCP